MAVGTADEFKGHLSGAVNAILVTAGRAKAALTAERDKFQFTAMGAGIHGTTEGRVAAVDHFFNILNDRVTRMKEI